MTKKFLRRIWNRYSKLGKRRKKKQGWKKPTGRDNKMREKRKGYPVVVSVGYKKGKQIRGIIKGKKPILVKNIQDLEKIGKTQIALLGKIGKKKKIEVVKKAKEMKIKFHNINIKTFLDKNKIKKKAEAEVKKTKDKKEEPKKSGENKK